MNVPKHIEELLEDLAESLQISPSRYEAAERSYASVGEWLQRDASILRDADPQIYSQGSFRLGTAIRPISEAEDYDVDLVCELSLSKSRLTQENLKLALSQELEAYAKAHGMDLPEEGRRCWTLNYADGAQFHLDTLAAIPDGARKRLLLEQRGLSTKWSESAIAITDRDHPLFLQVTNDWPHSNPKGYSNWFRSRMAVVFEARKRLLAMEERASVEDIPDHKVRTPLQNAIQILKRHRENMFARRSDDKPISIIITTLAAHAYQQESTIGGALYSILEHMDSFIPPYSLDDEGPIVVMDWDRHLNEWRILDGEDDKKRFSVEGMGGIAGDATEVILAVSVSYGVDLNGIARKFRDLPLVQMSLEAGSPSSHWSEDKQIALGQQFLDTVISIGNIGVRRIHLFLAAPSSVTFRFGRLYDKRNLPEVIVYQYERELVPPFPWGIRMPVSGNSKPEVV